VRYGGERAVVFIREFVPRPMITLTARLLYSGLRGRRHLGTGEARA
jgi:hypothetical protein